MSAKAADGKPYKKGFDISYTFGAFPTIELLKNRPEIARKVYVHSSFEIPEVMRRICDERGIDILVSDRIVERLRDKENIFVIGVFEKFCDELLRDKPHLVLVNPSDMGNLGTIMRTCAGFGIKDLAIISPGADIFNPRTIRSSMGALFCIRHHYFNSFDEYLVNAGRREVFLFMLSAKQQETLPECEKPGLFSLVFGNEATGLGREFEKYGKCIFIPQSDEVDSLNLTIAVALGSFFFMHGIKV